MVIKYVLRDKKTGRFDSGGTGTESISDADLYHTLREACNYAEKPNAEITFTPVIENALNFRCIPTLMNITCPNLALVNA